MRIILVFLLSVVTWGQNQKTDWQKDNLKGKVKSVRIFSYKYTDNSGKIENKQPLSNFNTIEEYNEKGQKIVGKRISNDGKVATSWLYSYDIANFLTKVEIFNDKNQIEEVLNYTYQPEAQQSEVLGYDATGKLHGKQIIRYDANGNKTSELSLDANGSFLLNSEFVYDVKQNVSERKFEDKGGKRVVLKYVYDDKNNVIEENYYGEGVQLYGQKKFSYKYDNQGNWIERTELIYDVERVVTEREIIYF